MIRPLRPILCFTEDLVQLLSNNVKIKLVPLEELNTSVAFGEKTYVARVLVNHSQRKDGAQHLFVC